MPKTHQKHALRLARKLALSLGAVFVAVFLGGTVGALLCFYYAYLLIFKGEKLQQIYNKTARSDIGLMRLWNWIKRTVNDLHK